jgi:hypothetical protein
MARINIHGGDFAVGQSGTFAFGVLTMPPPGRPFFGACEKIPLNKVMRVEAVNKEMRHRTGAALGRGLAGVMISGPIGAIVGFTTTNHASDVTFEAEFEGGRRLLATTNTATYTKLLAAAFDYKPHAERRPETKGIINKWLPATAIILGLLVIAGIINGSPLAWGIAVSAVIFIIGNKIFGSVELPLPAMTARNLAYIGSGIALVVILAVNKARPMDASMTEIDKPISTSIQHDTVR